MRLRTVAKQIRDGSRRSLNRIALMKGLATLERTLARGRTPDERLLRALERGWANTAWSADVAFLSAVLHWLVQTSGPIAECGSGLSTLVLACAASLTGRRVHSFEHDAGWAARLAHDLPSRFRQCVELNVTPLRSYGEFDWYSLDGITPPTDIGFVLCDGPPGKTRGGRYGLGPVMKPYLARGCIVLLDDTQRSSEHEVVLRWCEELGAEVIHEGSTFNVLEVRRSAQQRPQVAEVGTHR